MKDSIVTPEVLDHLDRDGYAVLYNFMSADRLNAIRLAIQKIIETQGDKAGTEFKQEPQTTRLANLVNCGELFEQIVTDADVLHCIRHVLGSDFKLSSLNYRSSHPHSDWTQPLHCDAGLLPDEKGNSVCNVIWLLDDFTDKNGPTRFVPGTHLSGKLPENSMPDPAGAHPKEKWLIAPAGTVVIMNAHLWHGALANQSDYERRAIHSFYCRRDKPQQQYQKALIDPQVQTRFSPELRDLLALDDQENDRLCSEQTSMSGFLR